MVVTLGRDVVRKTQSAADYADRRGQASLMGLMVIHGGINFSAFRAMPGEEHMGAC